jgi:hypothetical protein
MCVTINHIHRESEAHVAETSRFVRRLQIGQVRRSRDFERNASTIQNAKLDFHRLHWIDAVRNDKWDLNRKCARVHEIGRPTGDAAPTPSGNDTRHPGFAV